jgi:hypothetical protein
MTSDLIETRARVGLVGCVKSKRASATHAADLYTSALFLGRRRWVQVTCSRWFILSAKHGLVDPDTLLEPYDETLNDKGLVLRRNWTRMVLDQLRSEFDDLSHFDFEIHAGASYVAHGLRSGLLAEGCEVILPAEGLRQGEQLALYRTGPVAP